jgi:hypothetical protein
MKSACAVMGEDVGFLLSLSYITKRVGRQSMPLDKSC